MQCNQCNQSIFEAKKFEQPLAAVAKDNQVGSEIIILWWHLLDFPRQVTSTQWIEDGSILFERRPRGVIDPVWPWHFQADQLSTFWFPRRAIGPSTGSIPIASSSQGEFRSRRQNGGPTIPRQIDPYRSAKKRSKVV